MERSILDNLGEEVTGMHLLAARRSCSSLQRPQCAESAA